MRATGPTAGNSRRRQCRRGLSGRLKLVNPGERRRCDVRAPCHNARPMAGVFALNPLGCTTFAIMIGRKRILAVASP
jgi:hypothetical protein